MGTRNVIRTSVPLPCLPLSCFTLVARLSPSSSFLFDRTHLGEVLSRIPVSHFTRGTTHRPTLENAISSPPRYRRAPAYTWFWGRSGQPIGPFCPSLSLSLSYVFFIESSLGSRSKAVSFINGRFWRTSRWRWYRYIYESTRIRFVATIRRTIEIRTPLIALERRIRLFSIKLGRVMVSLKW